MDIYNIQALIKEGKIVTPSDIDPTNAYLQLGVYQEGNRKNNSANPAYPPYAIKLSDVGGGPTNLVVSTTRANLLTLQSTSSLVPGTTYLITDAQDALGGTVSMFASSNTTLESDGNWEFTAKLGAQGRFQLLNGAAGSVNQITITTPTGPVTLLSSPVAYTTSRNNTANLVAAAVNANTATTGVFAYVISSYTGGGNLDQPIICIETTTGQTGFVYTLSVSVTTLTIGSLTSPALGFNSAIVNLLSSYDITNDRIVYAEDLNYKIKISNTIEQITTFGYNPVTFFRWNDPRLNNWTLINSTVRDVQFRQTAVQRYFDVTLTNTTWRRFITINANQSRINMFASSLLQDINSVTGVNMNNVYGTVNISNVDSGQISISLGSRGGITFTNSTFGTSAGRATVTLFTPVGQVTLNNNNYPGTTGIQVVNNILSITGQILVQNNTWATGTPRLIINNNLVHVNMQFSENTGMDDVYITSNKADSPLVITNCNWTGAGQPNVNLQGNDFYGANTFFSTPLNCINVTGVTFGGVFGSGYLIMENSKGGFSYASNPLGELFVSRSFIDPNITWPQMGQIIMVDSHLQNEINLLYTFAAGCNLIMNRAQSYDSNYSTATTITLNNSTVVNCVFDQATSVTLLDSRCYDWTYNTLIGPDPVIDLRNTTIENGNWTTSIFYNFTTTPLIAGSPFFITWVPIGFGKEIGYVMVGGGLVESVPGTILQIDDGSTIAFQQSVGGLISGVFNRDTTPAASVLTSPSAGLLLSAIGGNITGGDAAITVTGKYMKFI